MTKALQLEEGKYYFDRAGRRYGPLVQTDHDSFYQFEDTGAESEWSAGGWYFDIDMPRQMDLIAEAPAPLNPSADGLPVYRCHKEVWAAKVIGVDRTSSGDQILVLGLPGGREHRVVARKNGLRERLPEYYSDAVGGYYVRYADGFESWSPAKAFEEGYTRSQD